MNEEKSPLWLPAAARVASGFVLGLGGTWRVERAEGYDALDRELLAGRKCIYALWHARLLPLVWSHRGRSVAVLVSRHRDGEWVARVVESLGFVTARGSSTRGGDSAVREMLEHAGRGHALAVTPDGPRGPAGRVKPGLVYLASRTGWPIVPVTAAASRSWTFRSWDRFRVPLPFTRVRLAYGEPITVPPDLDDAAEATFGARIGEALETLTRAADAAVGSAA